MGHGNTAAHTQGVMGRQECVCVCVWMGLGHWGSALIILRLVLGIHGSSSRAFTPLPPVPPRLPLPPLPLSILRSKLIIIHV